MLFFLTRAALSSRMCVWLCMSCFVLYLCRDWFCGVVSRKGWHIYEKFWRMHLLMYDKLWISWGNPVELTLKLNYKLDTRPLCCLFSACDDHYFGDGCSQMCGYCKNNSTCDKASGNCLYGCSDGYSGDDCRTGEFRLPVMKFTVHGRVVTAVFFFISIFVSGIVI